VGIYVRGRDCYIPNPARGLADITAIKQGKVIMIEVKKAKTGRQTPSQQEFQRSWEEQGGTYILARTLEDIISVIG